jgi:hypothetical protein
MTWAQLLKRVFAIEIDQCEKCGGFVRIIAPFEDPDAIAKILKHLGGDQPSDPLVRSPPPDHPPTDVIRKFKHTDDISVTISIGRNLDFRANSPNF